MWFARTAVDSLGTGHKDVWGTYMVQMGSYQKSLIKGTEHRCSEVEPPTGGHIFKNASYSTRSVTSPLEILWSSDWDSGNLGCIPGSVTDLVYDLHKLL